MTDSEEDALEKFDETVLVRINPTQSTLPIDTSAEWTKGFALVNQLIKELAEERYQDTYTDELGKTHKITKLHPQLPTYIDLRRKLMDQIWKISGQEAATEVKKETAKTLAKMIFETQMDRDTKEKYRKHVEKIIEVEAQNDDDYDKDENF